MYCEVCVARMLDSCSVSALVNSSSSSLKVEEPLFLLAPDRHLHVRDQGIFFVSRARENASQRVVIFLRNRIVLVVVAAGAGYGEAQQATRDGVDAFVALIRASLHRLCLIPQPRAAAQERGCRQCILEDSFRRSDLRPVASAQICRTEDRR